MRCCEEVSCKMTLVLAAPAIRERSGLNAAPRKRLCPMRLVLLVTTSGSTDFTGGLWADTGAAKKKIGTKKVTSCKYRREILNDSWSNIISVGEGSEGFKNIFYFGATGDGTRYFLKHLPVG